MRGKLVLAATLASLVTGSADAQTGLVWTDPHPSPADVVSADVAPTGVTRAAGARPANAVPPAAAVHPAAAFPASAAVPPAAAVPTATAVPPAASVGPAAAVPSSAVVPPVARARFYRPRVVRWVRRTRVRAAAPVRKLVPLTLPSFDMTAPFTRNGGKLIFAPPDDRSADAGMSSAPVSASGSPATAAPPPVGAAVVSVRAEPLAPPSRSDAEASKPRLPAANTARQASGEAELAVARTIPKPTYSWIEPFNGAAAPAILLRTGSETGLAAFRDGSEVLVVLDAPIDFRAPPIGLDPAFAQLSSQRTEDATVIRIPMASGSLSMARTARGWVVMAAAPSGSSAGNSADNSDANSVGNGDANSTGNGAGIVPRLVKSGSVTTRIRFPAAEPTRVVTVIDPRTGGRLLVGTQGAAGQAVPTAWQQAKFDLLPTLQGVVVAAISDDMRLRAEADGFTLSTGPQADSPIMQDADRQDSNAPIAGAMARFFNIPNGTAEQLSHELDQRIRAAGNAHALARSEPRLRVAEAMLALGMDVEAQSVIDVAASADPALMDTPRAIALRAVAAVLAGRLDQAAPLADPRLDGSAEIELWRGFLQATNDTATARDAQRLADGLPLILGYPQTLRDRLLPTALETMALYGEAEPAQAVLKTLPDDRTLDLARAMVLEMTNQPAAALQAYDRIANSSDRLRRYKATVRAAELRIQSGQLDARAGADVLDRALLGWRGAKQELALRTRIAALRRQAGQWKEALSVLRDGRDAFPEDHAQIDRELAATFAAFVADDSVRGLPPSEFVALYDQNADLVRDIAWTEQTGTALVDRLIGLGLQGRAQPVMERLVAQSTDPVQRARLGARLADLRMTLDDPDGAIAALAGTVPPAHAAIAPAMMEARQLLYGHAESQRGNQDAALAMLSTLQTAKADAARADIYTARKDWPQTVAALTAWEHKAISTADLTDKQQAMVMRLAVAATLSGDTATLDRLAGTYGAAMAKGRSAAFFRVLTAAPVRDKDDLPRAFQEIQLTRQLVSNPDELENP